MSDHAPRSPSPYVTGLSGRCPCCGEGRLFYGFLAVRPKCDICGLDFAFADAGDGPAVFIVLLAGAVVVALALIVEFAYRPPFWIHVLLWGPLILLATLLPLRPLKGLMIAIQYHHQEEAERSERGGS